MDNFIRLCICIATQLALAACTVKDPLYCESSADCHDPARPLCDVQGQFEESDHIKKSCIPTPANCPAEVCGCTAGELVSCEQGNAIRCGADGMSTMSEACAMGCDKSIGGCTCAQGDSKCEAGAVEVCESSGAFSAPSSCALGCAANAKRCIDIGASNGLNAALDSSLQRSDFTLTSGASFDTVSGIVLDSGGLAVPVPSITVAQPSGAPTIRAFIVKSITLYDTKVTGTNAFAIVADDAIALDGTLMIAGRGTVAGPGASTATPCRGHDTVLLPGSGTPASADGAGGAGHATVGGGVPSGDGGAAYGSDAVLPLVGGCAGGVVRNQDGSLAGLPPVAGGGAVQLVARRSISIGGTTGVSGVIDAGGAGGPPGGGGSSGGAVLLEAPTVAIDGPAAGVFVNGGAGGGSCAAGADGTRTTAPSAGGSCPAGSNANVGGSGGVGSAAPTAGMITSCPCVLWGWHAGGGGSVGRLRVNTADATFAPINGAAISASFTVGTLATR